MKHKMNQDVKKKWVDALRSGEYKQGSEYLGCQMMGTEVYCTLGVLCEVAAKEGVVEKDTVSSIFEYDGASYGLPQRVMDWAGLVSANPSWHHDDGGKPIELAKELDVRFNEKWGEMNTVTLAQLNDRGATFEELAEIIEEYL